MMYPKGYRPKARRTLRSRLSNLSKEKRKSCKALIPESYSLKAGFPRVWLQCLYGNCTSYAVLACNSYIYHTDKFYPSMTFTYYNQKKGEKPMVDDGSDIETALRAVKKYGACDSKVWDNAEPFDKKPSEKAYENGLHGHEIKKWHELHNITEIKKSIAAGYPVVIPFSWAFKSWDENYILKEPTKKEIKNASCHAVVIVGYDDKMGVFEIRNSWGTGWCNEGYCYMRYSTVNKCIAMWEDTYAVVK